MMDRVALIQRRLLNQVMRLSLALGVGLCAGGCGGQVDTTPKPSDMPEAAKSLQEYMKKQAASQKGAVHKRKPGPASR